MAKKNNIKKSQNIISRINENGSYSVLRLDDYDNYYQIDGVYGEFWSMIDGKKSEADLVSSLSKKYPDQAKKVAAKVKSWLGELKKNGFIE